MASTGSRALGPLGRLLLHIGMLLAGLAFTSWWVSHTILDVSRTQRVTHAVLSDADFRTFLAGEISPELAAVEPVQDSATLRDQIAVALADPSVQSQLETFVVDIHKGLLGTTDHPAVLSQATLSRIVVAADPSITPTALAGLRPISVDPPRLGALSATRRLLADNFGVLVAAAAILLVCALALSSDRRQSLNLIGRWLIGISLFHLVVLWLIPVVVIPDVSSSPWASLIAAVARALGAGLVGGLAVVLAVGVGLVVIDRLVGRPATN